MNVYLLSMIDVTQEQIQFAYRRLPKIQQQQSQSIKTKQQQQIFIYSRLLLYTVFERYGIHQPIIEKGIHGKPYLKEYPNIHFNLSHTKQHIAVCFDTDSVGIDIETIRTQLPKYLNKICSPKELQFLEIQPNKPITFTTLWTRKEAYVKQQGGRIFDHTNQIEVATETMYLTQKNDCMLQSYVYDTCVVSICAKQHIVPPTQITISQLLSGSF